MSSRSPRLAAQVQPELCNRPCMGGSRVCPGVALWKGSASGRRFHRSRVLIVHALSRSRRLPLGLSLDQIVSNRCRVPWRARDAAETGRRP
jgi:hypothetical protein